MVSKWQSWDLNPGWLWLSKRWNLPLQLSCLRTRFARLICRKLSVVSQSSMNILQSAPCTSYIIFWGWALQASLSHPLPGTLCPRPPCSQLRELTSYLPFQPIPILCFLSGVIPLLTSSPSLFQGCFLWEAFTESMSRCVTCHILSEHLLHNICLVTTP